MHPHNKLYTIRIRIVRNVVVVVVAAAAAAAAIEFKVKASWKKLWAFSRLTSEKDVSSSLYIVFSCQNDFLRGAEEWYYYNWNFTVSKMLVKIVNSDNTMVVCHRACAKATIVALQL